MYIVFFAKNFTLLDLVRHFEWVSRQNIEGDRL